MSHYPSDEVLRAIGRVTVAASRVDRSLSQLWATLDRTVAGTITRKAMPTKSRERIARLAQERLDDGPLLEGITTAVVEAEKVAEQRNALVHGDWIIVEPTLALDEDGRPFRVHEQLMHLKRRREDAENGRAPFRELPHRAWDLALQRPVQEVLDELRTLAGRLEQSQHQLEDLADGVARARDLGDPPGWHVPPAPGSGRRSTATLTFDGLVLTDAAPGGRRCTVPLVDADAGEPNGGRRWNRVLPWCERDDGLLMDTRLLDRALERHGWHRVEPWIDDGDSSRTTVDRMR